MISSRKLLVLTSLVTFSACSSLEPARLTPKERAQVISRTTWGQPTPKFGLALAGGGTKASSFSMGVLRGFVQTGLIERVDILSTVSGGSYAGLWFYYRYVLDDPSFRSPGKTSLATQKTWFQDCYPARYWTRLDLAFLGVDKKLVKGSSDGQKAELQKLGLNPCPAGNFSNYLGGKNYAKDAQSENKEELDKYRYQNYLRGYQDIFNLGNDILGRPAFDYDPTSQSNRLVAYGTPVAFQTLGAMALTIVPNYLFDWEINLSPTRRVYRNGIARTYGASPIACYNGGCVDVGKMKGMRLEGNAEKAKSIGFDEIKRVSEVKGAPLWVVNATAGEDRSIWDLRKPSPFDLTAFEFTAYGAGSGLYSYDFKPQQILPSPLEASVASAAFLDTQQKWVGNPPGRNGLAMAMKVFTAEWGVSVKNPNLSDAAYRAHYALPFPLYYAHYFQATENSAYIHLSDGGQSENLGAYALVRRHVRAMVLSDHAQDEKGTMGDVCRFKNGLPDDLTLVLPGLQNLDEQCLNNDKDEYGYNVYQWKSPVLVGCIIPKSQAVSQANKIAMLKGENKNGEGGAGGADSTVCGKLDHPGIYQARVFIIKPALANTGLLKSLERFSTACFPAEDKNNTEPEKSADSVCSRVIIEECTASRLEGDDSPMWKGAPPPSCEVYSFLKLNGSKGPGLDKSGCPIFPQYSTVAMTANSSPWMYGAMRDLASYYAERVSWFFNNQGDLDNARFEQEMRYQASSPIRRQRVAAMHANSVGQRNLAKCLGEEPTQGPI